MTGAAVLSNHRRMELHRLVAGRKPESVRVMSGCVLLRYEGLDEMKSHLRSLDLPVSGKKDDLAARIREADPAAVLLDDARAAHAEQAAGKMILAADELEKAKAIRDSVMSHPKAGALFSSGSGQAELSVYWTDRETGILCRCRPDFFRNDGVVVDLKTALDASLDGFERSVEKWRYHVQAAFYLDGIRAARAAGADITEPQGFIFVAVEKTAPFAVGVYHIDAQAIEIGRRKYREDLTKYAECVSTGKWPAYSDKIESISLPAWVLRREEIEESERGVYEESERGVYIA